ncbi:hypothetical protein GCM10011375_12180 [Hymenobacter qilianensis]|uniref:Uncharacterized protein n=2 Tax=Hymenobacter qilianensis TaxID=1385715 RepID=A0ACB5PP88_9BACT|nr:hypothetical protein [Hymenobacter qilianensis]QNP53222.1 hypothetical protein H9L05_06205 [Hymenobacter qilianensis]GGF58568.1 hypothetical protein GCM10011375_12180 [Hymenobacter qilianensis]
MTQQILDNFLDETLKVRHFDRDNQLSFSRRNINLWQLHILTESVFLKSFRNYENYLRDIFTNYCCEAATVSGTAVVSFLKPRDSDHAETLLKSAMPFLDWSSPISVISRAEVYLQDGIPVKSILIAKTQNLKNYKLIRNHIAHNSKESSLEYNKVLKSYFSTFPLTPPPPGEFLLMPSKKAANKYNLILFFDEIEAVAKAIAQ